MANDESSLMCSDMVMTRQGLRQDWAIDPAVKKQILQRVIAYLVPNSDQGRKVEDQPRAVIAAAEAVALFGKLALEQQKLDLKGTEAEEEDCREALLSEAEEIVRGRYPDDP